MPDAFNFGVTNPGGVSYDVGPGQVDFSKLADIFKQQKQGGGAPQQQPGQPLNIQSDAQRAAMQPGFLDRLRQFFTPAQQSALTGTSPQAFQPPNPVVSTDVGEGPTRMVGPQPDRSSMEQFLLRNYGTPGSEYWAPGTTGWEQRQMGGPVGPYANRLMPFAGAPLQLPIGQRSYIPPGYTAGGSIG
jgi:hypothetical protein